MNSIIRKLARSISHPLFCYLSTKSWFFLKYYPHVIPDGETLERWQTSEWPEYQNWINQHSLIAIDKWKEQHIAAKKSDGRVKISIVTPVYNTKASILKECILSVRTQTSPYWEFILSDDGSTNKDTLDVFNSRFCKDPRIKVIFQKRKSSSGISAATNRAIDISTGNYIVFLDHDDRIAPEAIQNLITAIENEPELDILYSDRDMLSLGGKRFMHLMKPDWSPENLYAGNYIFHLMCYKRDLLLLAGKLRPEFDGSQDYDLILRCMELSQKIKHIPKVLYHWRQSDESVSLESGAKEYAFDAGMSALREALTRRNIKGIVSENRSLWRGNYEVELPLPSKEQIGLISLPENLTTPQYFEVIMENPLLKDMPPYIFIHQEGLIAEHDDSTRILASWLELENIGITSGCIVSNDQKIVYAGMIFNNDGGVKAPYKGADVSEPGYMAATKAVRNISVPNPFSVMIKRELWQQFNGLNPTFRSQHTLFDFALTAIKSKWRVVYVPRAIFLSRQTAAIEEYPNQEKKIFYQKWQEQLDHGDPYYSCNLDTNSNSYELT